MPDGASRELRVGLAGFGAVGRCVAGFLDRGLPGLTLVAVSARDLERARRAMDGFRAPAPAVPLERIADDADVVVECAPAGLFESIAVQTLERGKTLVAVSSGALFGKPHLVELARRHGGRIFVPSGALLGLDAVRAAALGRIESIRMESRKPVRGLAGAPLLERDAIDIDGIAEPRLLFEGTAAEAIAGFPANLNVAVSLGLAGPGPEAVSLRVWADPNVTRNVHTVELVSDSADLTMTIRNIPSDENPRTGRITALSVVATLKRMVDPLVVGT